MNKVTIQLVREEPLTVAPLVAAYVNATNSDLVLSDDLLDKAGPDVQSECTQIGWCPVGAAVITNAGQLEIPKIIHTAGPRWGEGAERGKLTNATLECLRLAESHRLKSIVFPAISTGALGYPVENCAKTMLTQIIDYTFEDLKALRKIILALPTEAAYAAFKQEFKLQLQELRETGDGQVKV
ncbi:MAG: O-acetyl-ADP-ribose deacetylase [Chloroflexi bacterium]|nr:O-acetyl-ADP-ribose deacetylase [Chloroflexota bacterium]